jgi:hypothetical protein
MEVVIPLVPSVQGEVRAEVIARVVGTPDFLVATRKHAWEPADRTMLAEMALEVLTTGKCCVARVSVVIWCDTDKWLLFDVVISVNEAVSFKANTVAFELQIDPSSIAVGHLSDRPNPA